MQSDNNVNNDDNNSNNPLNILARAQLVKTRHVGEYLPAKTGEYPRISEDIPQFLKPMDNKHNSLNLDICPWTLSHSFPRATVSQNCSLLETDNVRGQICEHIFAPNEGYCLFIEAVVIIVTDLAKDDNFELVVQVYM